MKINLVISGRSYRTSGDLPTHLELPDGATLSDAVTALSEKLPADAGLPDSCLVAVSGTHLGTLATHQPRTLADGDELVIIAPVAGG